MHHHIGLYLYSTGTFEASYTTLALRMSHLQLGACTACKKSFEVRLWGTDMIHDSGCGVLGRGSRTEFPQLPVQKAVPWPHFVVTWTPVMIRPSWIDPCVSRSEGFFLLFKYARAWLCLWGLKSMFFINRPIDLSRAVACGQEPWNRRTSNNSRSSWKLPFLNFEIWHFHFNRGQTWIHRWIHKDSF